MGKTETQGGQDPANEEHTGAAGGNQDGQQGGNPGGDSGDAQGGGSGLYEGIPEDHPVRGEVERLRREAAARRNSANEVKQENEQLKDSLSKAKSQDEIDSLVEEYQNKIAQIEADKDTEVLRHQVARTYKVDDEFFEFLTGSDEDTLKQQAEKLARRSSTTGPTPPPTGGRQPGAEVQTAEDFAARIRKQRRR